MVRTPLVTGISPKEGPPGTRVTIRGENLGLDRRALTGLKICGVDCYLSAMWHSSKRIVARTGLAKGKGDIIVMTKSGGVGSSTVQFKGYNIQIGPLQESGIWIDEAQFVKSRTERETSTSPIVEQATLDPLGFTDHGNNKKPTEEELQEMIPDGSGNTNLENFEPTWYLLENHQKTSFDDLKRGLVHLKHKLEHFDSGPFTFAKNNLSTFFQCLDTLTDVNSKIVDDEDNNHHIPCTSLLEHILLKSNQSAEVIFTEVLGRKEKADTTMNALNVLHRYKLLFHLPSTMKKNIAKGDYDLVITDYTRTNSLTWLKGVPVFAKVFAEIEGSIEQFKRMLHSQLMQLPSSLEDQKRYIRYITHLDHSSDVAWSCISNYHNWIISSMHQCQQQFVEQEKEEDIQKTSLSSLMASFNDKQQPSNNNKYNNKYNNNNTKVPPRVSFIEQLCRILCTHLPHLHKLGSYYLEGKHGRNVDGPTVADEKKKTEFKILMHKIIESYSNLIRRAFLSESITDQSMLRDQSHDWPIRSQESMLTFWLPMCVKHVRSSISNLQPLGLSEDSIGVLLKLDWLLRSNCVDCILNQAIIEGKRLGVKEIWRLNVDEEDGCTTLLPSLFEGIVDDVTRNLQHVLTDHAHERKLFADESKSKKKTHNLCISLLQSFATTLYQLANSSEDDNAVAINSSGNSGITNMNTNRRVSRAKEKKAEELPKDKRLLIILNNSSMTSRVVIPRLITTLQHYHYPLNNHDTSAIQRAYNGLYEGVFKQYINHKVDAIVATLEHNMNMACKGWDQCPTPTGVGYYVKKCLLSFVNVHAEVCSIGPVFVGRVMEAVLGATAEEVGRVVLCVPQFNHHGALQARLDVEAFEIAIGVHKTNETKKFLRDAIKVIPDLTKEQYITKDRMTTVFKSQMFFYLQCFKTTPK